MQSSSVVFQVVDVPCSGPLHFSQIADYVYDLCHSLTYMLALLSLYVVLSIRLSTRNVDG